MTADRKHTHRSLLAAAACLTLLTSAAAAQSVQGGPKTAALEGRYWRASELAGLQVTSPNPTREAYLQFETGGRVSGSDSCNRIFGSYQLNGDAITFGQMMGTQMACQNTGDVERAFREALKSSARISVVGDRLELFDGSGKRVALFVARTQAASPGLDGTSWQLVQFRGGDGKTLTPDDRAKYTLAFGAGGNLTARIDCNRGRGSWKSSGASQIELGPMALTRAMCAPGSLHDQIVKQLGNIRSYVMKDGHLFLSLMADGGIYEFEPLVTE
jgi:heat shock protein HslJ